MKKLLFLLVCVCCFGLLSSQAQDSKILGGIGASYSTEIDNIGIFANGVYKFTDTWEASLRYTYVFEKDMVTWQFIDLDGHYVFAEKGNAMFYGLAGLNILLWKVDLDLGIAGDSADGSELGFNLGAGTRLPISDTFDFMAEAKYVFGEFDHFNIGVGVLYKF